MTTGLVETLTSTANTEDSDYRAGRDTNKYCQERTVTTGLKTLTSTANTEDSDYRAGRDTNKYCQDRGQ